MKASRSKIENYDALVAGRYGIGAPPTRRFKQNARDLLAGYYGVLPSRGEAAPAIARAQSLGQDDGGEILHQRRRRAISRAQTAGTAPLPVEMPAPAPLPVAPPSPPVPADPYGRGMPDEERARQEQLLDLAAAPHAAPSPFPPAAVAPPPAPLPVMPPPAPLPVPPSPFPTYPADSAGPAEPEKSKQASENEFMADMHAIMSGQKSYDPLSKKLIDRHGVTPPPEAHGDAPPPPSTQPPPPPTPSSGHDIFQRIAQSMEYAGAYDLGAVELENRFAQFDQADASRPKPPIAPPIATPAPPPPPPPAPDALRQDLQDMLVRPEIPSPPKPPSIDELLPGHGAEGGPVQPPPAQPLSLDRLPDYAQPLYDTGEHILSGGTLYPDQLRVGPPPGVAFSYGDIIAMADLYETDADMMAASAGELTKLKQKIRDSAAHYRAARGARPPAPGSEDWKAIIGDRYLRLAEDNYTHFSPNIFFRDKAFASKIGNNSNHQTEWERYHQRAITEAQRLALLPSNQGVSYIPESALIINAFGDHFLTDAFSSGHVINKAEVMGMFFANFYTGDTLNSAGETFLGNVAKLAFKGKLKSKFSVLETHDPVFLWWNPNIDTENAFRKLLIAIANDKAIGKGKVANLAVKALHDKLNESGIEVVNGNGRSWRLFGDAYMDKSDKTLGIMHQAVQQSVANLLDTGILVSNLDLGPYFDRVWAHVPTLSASSRAEIMRLMPTFINPASTELAAKAAKILHDEVDTLIDELIKNKKLKYA